MAQYFIPKEISYEEIKGRQGLEKERGLDDECDMDKKKHDWLLLPKEEGQKQYIMCLKCLNIGHL